MSFGGWLKKQAKKAVGAVGDFMDSDLGWIIPPLKVGYESIDWASGGGLGKLGDQLKGKKPGGGGPGVDPIIPLDSDPFDQAAVADRQRASRRMADGIQETFLTGPGAGIKPGVQLGPEQIITTMSGREREFEAATGTSIPTPAVLEARRRAKLLGF